MTDPEMAAFQLSRIYAQGWNAGKAGAFEGDPEELDSFVDSLNPHVRDPERTRWAQGYKDAVKRGESGDGRKSAKLK